MDFSHDAAAWQRRISETPEGISRRSAVFNALAIKPGQSILDAGCGGGHLVRDIALAVTDRGRVIGSDTSSDQLAAAQNLCDGLGAVEFMNGDASHIDLPDGSLDRLCSIQMLDYVENVDLVLDEARRLVKVGGTVALVSVLWDHFRFHGADTELDRRINEAWREHCSHQMLPLEMDRRLRKTGFGGVHQQPMAFLNSVLHPQTYGYWAAKIVASYAVGLGVAKDDAARWLRQLEQADEEGRFGFVSVPVLTTAAAV